MFDSAISRPACASKCLQLSVSWYKYIVCCCCEYDCSSLWLPFGSMLATNQLGSAARIKSLKVPSGNQASGLLCALLPKPAKGACASAIITLVPGGIRSSSKPRASPAYPLSCLSPRSRIVPAVLALASVPLLVAVHWSETLTHLFVPDSSTSVPVLAGREAEQAASS